MFLMTGRARPVLHDVGLMDTVFLVTALTFAIDRLDRDAIVKTIT